MRINKVKILWWVIGLLVVLNVTTIATVFYHSNQSGGESVLLIEPDGQMLSGCVMRQKLNLDKDQAKSYCEMNRRFCSEARQIIAVVDEKKEGLFKELTAQNPDTTRILAISSDIGELHKDLKVATARFYLSMRDVCNPEQKKQLQKIFTPLFLNPSSTFCTGKGHGKGKAKGQVSGRCEEVNNQFKQ